MNKENVYKHLEKTKDDIQNSKIQSADELFEDVKEELTVYEQIKLGINQAIDYEKKSEQIKNRYRINNAVPIFIICEVLDCFPMTVFLAAYTFNFSVFME